MKSKEKEILPWLQEKCGFTLTEDEVKELLSSRCYHCNSEPSKDPIFKKHPELRMIRIDETRGYIKGNFTPCCLTCKFLARTGGVKGFQLYLKALLMLKDIKAELVRHQQAFITCEFSYRYQRLITKSLKR